MITREASEKDWDKLEHFFLKIYRKKHPLQKKEFWEWQYGDKEYGRSFICLNDNGDVVGHIGVSFVGGLAWMLNAYLDKKYRGKGVMSDLFALARGYFPLAATGASNLGLGMFKNMGWIRYNDLVRYVKISPIIKEINIENVCKKVSVAVDNLIVKDTHYFQQPSIKGLLLNQGSRAVSQEEVGGLRIVDFTNLKSLEDEAWELGYLWMDYITSCNDLKIKNLEKNNWVLDFKSVVPWRLNPIEANYFCDTTFLSEEILDKNFIVHRSYSDHGRIGSL